MLFLTSELRSSFILLFCFRQNENEYRQVYLNFIKSKTKIPFTEIVKLIKFNNFGILICLYMYILCTYEYIHLCLTNDGMSEWFRRLLQSHEDLGSTPVCHILAKCLSINANLQSEKEETKVSLHTVRCCSC